MRFLLVAFSLALAGCGSSGTLDYVPPATVVAGPTGAVAAVAVVDRRDEKPNRVATIRGGYGNPIYVLDTPTPVANQVEVAFTKALQARGMLSPTGPFRFAVTLHTLYADQFIGPKAEIKMDLTVSDASGRTVYSDAAVDKTYQFVFFANGVFADIQELRKEAEKLLDATLDKMLDKPALRAALATNRATAPVS